jgi:hypothetical protein
LPSPGCLGQRRPSPPPPPPPPGPARAGFPPRPRWSAGVGMRAGPRCPCGPGPTGPGPARSTRGSAPSTPGQQPADSKLEVLSCRNRRRLDGAGWRLAARRRRAVHEGAGHVERRFRTAVPASLSARRRPLPHVCASQRPWVGVTGSEPVTFSGSGTREQTEHQAWPLATRAVTIRVVPLLSAGDRVSVGPGVDPNQRIDTTCKAIPHAIFGVTIQIPGGLVARARASMTAPRVGLLRQESQ